MGPGTPLTAPPRRADEPAAAEEGEGGGVGQARLRRRHIENPTQASPAKAIKEVDGSGTV